MLVTISELFLPCTRHSFSSFVGTQWHHDNVQIKSQVNTNQLKKLKEVNINQKNMNMSGKKSWGRNEDQKYRTPSLL